MQLKHTKGPWKNFGRLVDIEGRLIADCMTPDDAETYLMEDEANARLISCAPEMLEALIQHATDQYLSFEDAWGIIEKATGLKRWDI